MGAHLRLAFRPTIVCTLRWAVAVEEAGENGGMGGEEREGGLQGKLQRTVEVETMKTEAMAERRWRRLSPSLI